MKYRAEVLYQHIDTLIKDDEIYPICVPSYNRPNAPFLKFVDNLPVVLFIRKEQEDLYKDYKEKCKIVLLDNVAEIGQTRKAIVDWAIKEGLSNIFMLDDDVTLLSFMMPGQSSQSKDKEFMKPYITINNIPESPDKKVFKMWVWMIEHCSDKLTISGAGNRSDWWNIRYKDSQTVYNSGSTIQCIHLNIDNLKKYDINYVDTRIGGTEDYTLQYQVMAAGLHTCIFKDLVYRSPAVGNGTGGNKTNEELVEKYHKFIELFQKNIMAEADKPKVGIKTSKGGVPSIKFNWVRWRTKEYMMYTADTIYDEVELVVYRKKLNIAMEE